MEATLSVIGGLWKPVLLFHLLEGKLRFNALCRLTPSATARMITLQLRELEADGIIVRHVFAEIPPKVEYELTEMGRSLAPVLLSMREWGDKFRGTTASNDEDNVGASVSEQRSHAVSRPAETNSARLEQSKVSVSS